MSNQSLDLVQATAARALWTKAVRPVATELGFKPGKTVMKGWVREATAVRLTFWFQVTMFGFDKRSGGKFIVELTTSDPGGQASLRNRIWQLLDPQSQREAIRINNAVVASLPGPAPEILNSLPEFLRSTYLASFKVSNEIPQTTEDVWFRYATTTDAERWGEFVASRLPAVVAECERRLRDLPHGSAPMMGVDNTRKPDQ